MHVLFYADAYINDREGGPGCSAFCAMAHECVVHCVQKKLRPSVI